MMKALGTDIGTIHFVGIGGIGMSGIAEVMHQLGYKVQGSDIAENYVVDKLRKKGIPVSIGHRADNLGDAAVIVCSTAIKENNPEIAAAVEKRLPRVRRAEMLAELMRMQKTIAVAGTHGKTTTTSMIACLLDAGGIDPEHLEHYGTFDRAKDAFVEFVENVPFYGLAVMCIDHPEVQSLIGRIRDRRIVTYGFSALADLRADNVEVVDGGSQFDAVALQRDGSRRVIEGIRLPMPGRHNVLNALAAIAVGMELGMDDAAIARGFEKFDGVKRRFTRVGEVEGAIVIDDYAHHPVEIRAALSAARESAAGRVIAVVQPHRYTRLQALMDDFQAAFNDADIVMVAPVYPAGEDPIEGVDAAALAEGLRAHGHRMVKLVDNPKDLAGSLRDIAAKGDMILCLGAGDITKWAAGLADGIRKARAAKK
jgi:UDP-N-acetylmuramate--alanine ligase